MYSSIHTYVDGWVHGSLSEWEILIKFCLLILITFCNFAWNSYTISDARRTLLFKGFCLFWKSSFKSIWIITIHNTLNRLIITQICITVTDCSTIFITTFIFITTTVSTKSKWLESSICGYIEYNTVWSEGFLYKVAPPELKISPIGQFLATCNILRYG